MSTSSELIQKLDDARQEVHKALEGFDREKEIYPGWTIRHFLAHLIGWDEATSASLQAFLQGDRPGTPAHRGIDHYNQQSVETRQYLSYEQVVKEWEHACSELKSLVNRVPEERFTEELIFPWGHTGTVKQLVGVIIHHEHEHAKEIEELKHKPTAG